MVFSEVVATVSPWAPVVLRLAVGPLFMVHGYPKLTAQREGTRQFMKSVGSPSWMAEFAGFAEFFGGLAILIGLLTPLSATLASIWMLQHNDLRQD